MRILIAPDGFGEALDAVAVARAIAAGWHGATGDETVILPLSDGGPGFVAAMHAAVGGRLVPAYVSGPLGRQVPVRWLRCGEVAYLEAAGACGRQLLAPAERDPRRTTTAGVGELLLLAAGHGARRCVVGLGGSATNDGGAGAWAALGAEPARRLRAGGAALRGLGTVTVPRLPAGMDLVVATDVDNPLLGPEGATRVFGPQKGADPAAVPALEAALSDWADAVEAAVGRPGLRDAPGAGAAGGLGFGLLALGARRVAGAGMVAEAVDLRGRLASADLVVTGEGRVDHQSRRGKVVAAVAVHARQHGVPCLVVAGEVRLAAEELEALGIAAACAVADVTGSVAAGIASGAAGVQEAARQLAVRWKRGTAKRM